MTFLQQLFKAFCTESVSVSRLLIDLGVIFGVVSSNRRMGPLKNEEQLEGIEGSAEAILYVNGVRKVLPDGLAHLTLLEYLRGNVSDDVHCLVSGKIL